MTAEIVNGLAVVACEPAHSPLSKPGKEVVFRQIMLLMLEDESMVYGCLWCDFSADSAARVRPHLRKHTDTSDASDTGKPSETAAAHPGIADMTVAQLQLSASNALTWRGERDDAVRELERALKWKPRAQTAESQLKALRKALAQIG